MFQTFFYVDDSYSVPEGTWVKVMQDLFTVVQCTSGSFRQQGRCALYCCGFHGLYEKLCKILHNYIFFSNNSFIYSASVLSFHVSFFKDSFTSVRFYFIFLVRFLFTCDFYIFYILFIRLLACFIIFIHYIVTIDVLSHEYAATSLWLWTL